MYVQYSPKIQPLMPDVYKITSRPKRINVENSFIFISGFPLRRVAGETAQGGRETPRGFQRPLIVLVAPHQDETKQGRKRSNST